jgi:hypothetical protein
MNKDIANSRRDFIKKSTLSVAFLALGFSSKSNSKVIKKISPLANLWPIWLLK